MKKDFILYLRLLSYAKPYWKVVVISVIGMLVSAGLEPVLPALMQPLIDKSLIQRHDVSLWQVPLFIVLTFTFKGVADYVANISSQTVAQNVMSDLRDELFAHYLDLPLSRHREEAGGRMLSRITYDTAMVGEAVSTIWLTLIRDTLVLVGLVGFLFYTAWQLTFLIIFISPLLIFLIRRINIKLRRFGERVQSSVGNVSGLIEESLMGLEEIKIFRAQHLQSFRFKEASTTLKREQLRAFKIQALNVPLVQVIAACVVSYVIFTASTLSRQDLLTPGQFVAYVAAMSMIFEPIRRLTNVSASLQKGLAAAGSVFTILDEPLEGMGKATGFSSVGVGVQEQDVPAIEFSNVSYRHAGQSEHVLKGLSFKVRAGEHIYICGESGSGKSTILKLICGFDFPHEGDVLIHGVSTRSLSLDTLRQEVTVVSQNTFLMDESIEANILMAKPNANSSEIIDALKTADAWNFISKLPLGMRTKVGVLATKLSGGQRQKLSLARAILKSSGILLLDEPTSALDDSSELKVIDGITEKFNGKTVVTVTHKLELISADASRIII